MTNDDELLKRLESTGGDKGFPWTTMTQAAARIRKLKAEVEALKHDIERYVTIASVEGDDG